MSAPRLVRRCACAGCPRLTLWPACALHRPAEMLTADRARFGGALDLTPTTTGAGRPLPWHITAGDRTDHETKH